MSGTICIIPARAGSKRILHKNVKPFCGDKSLVILACQQAMRLQHLLDDIVLTSDDHMAIAQAEECGVPIIRQRPKHLASDEASSESAIEDALEFAKLKNGKTYTNILLLEPTSPLRLGSDIIKALELAKNGRGVKSVVAVKNCLDGEIISDRYQLEGSIHMWRTDWLRDTPYNRFNLLEIPVERAWHIDYQWQFDCAELIYKRLHGMD